MKPNIVTDISPTYWHNFGPQVMGHNPAGQLNCRIL